MNKVNAVFACTSEEQKGKWNENQEMSVTKKVLLTVTVTDHQMPALVNSVTRVDFHSHSVQSSTSRLTIAVAAKDCSPKDGAQH